MSSNEELKKELEAVVKNHDSMCARLNEKLAKGRAELGIKTLEDFVKFKAIEQSPVLCNTARSSGA